MKIKNIALFILTGLIAGSGGYYFYQSSLDLTLSPVEAMKYMGPHFISPRSITVDGDFRLSAVTTEIDLHTLIVNGNFHVSDATISQWPQHLVVHDNMQIDDSEIPPFRDVQVGNNDRYVCELIINNTKFRTMESESSPHQGRLNLMGRAEFDHIYNGLFPQQVFVSGGLTIHDSSISRWPEQFQVGYEMMITNSTGPAFKALNVRHNLSITNSKFGGQTDEGVIRPYSIDVGRHITLSQSVVDFSVQNIQMRHDFSAHDSTITHWPTWLTVGADISIGRSVVPRFDQVAVGGSFFISDSEFDQLPAHLTVPGNLYLKNTQLSVIPTDLNVAGFMVFARTHVKKLPKSLKINDDISLCQTEITSLPDDFSIKGSIYLCGSNIKTIPPRLNVGGDFDVTDTSVTFIPETIRVGGKLSVNHTQVTLIPQHLDVKSLSVSGTKVMAIPAGMTLDTLDISDTAMTQLPEDLRVNSLVLSRSKITHLPTRVWGAKSLDISHSDVKALPDHLSLKYLNVADTPFTTLPVGTQVSEQLILGKNITSLPNYMVLPDDVNIADSHITVLPKNLHVQGDLDLRRSEVTHMSSGTVIEGDLIVEGSKLQSLPKDLRIGGDFQANKSDNLVPTNNQVKGQIRIFQ